MELDVDVNELEEFSPEKVAHTIFSTDPKAPCSNQMLAYEEGADVTFIFEILITILMEGFDKFTNGFDDLDMKKFSSEHIYALDPWIKSLGFKINIETCDKVNKDKYQTYYCKIIIRTKLHETLFIMKNIHKKYHFFLNGPYIEENKKKDKLTDLKAVFINDDTDVVYIINFKMCDL